jgi:uncharacterized SAM-binding protein YcdF (DUF218 family)
VIRWAIRLFVLLLSAYLIGYALFAMLLPGPAGEERTDAIVVLTGGSGRLDRGFSVMQRGLARKMLISGVAPTVKPRELAAAYHVDPALFDCCITLGREAVDTRSNADEVAGWLAANRIHSIRLVTNDLHMRRARTEIVERIGPDFAIVSDAVPAAPEAKQVFVEYNKYLLGSLANRIGF